MFNEEQVKLEATNIITLTFPPIGAVQEGVLPYDSKVTPFTEVLSPGNEGMLLSRHRTHCLPLLQAGVVLGFWGAQEAAR